MTPERVACEATTAKGTPCKLPAVVGLSHCAVHAGLSNVGRPSLLTDEIADAIEIALRTGNYVHVAVRAVGIALPTFEHWMARGNSTAARDRPYRELRERVEKARAAGQVRLVAMIAQAAQDDWRAATWLLERQHPELWAAVSVRYRDEAPPPPAPEAPIEGDPFLEVDELAERRRSRTAG